MYNEKGLRTAKITPTGTTKFVYNGNKLITELATTHRLDFLYDENGKLFGFIKDSSTTYYYVRDSLSNILGIISDQGQLVAKYNCTAFGACTVTQDTNGIGTLNPFRYKGYYYDSESNMYYCLTRYYVPGWCRWLNADDPKYLQLDSVTGLNLFAYCGNDPVSLIDTDGYFPVTTLIIATAIGAVIGATVEVGKQIYDDGNWNWDWTTWNLWEIGKGALIGAASGLAYGLGGIAGGIVKGSVKALTIAGKALTVSQSVGVLLGVAASTSFIGGFGGYALHTAGTPEDEFNFFKGLSEGLGQSAKGLLSFGTGGMFGAAGVWEFAKGIPVGKKIVNAMGRGIARLAANYIPNCIIDWIF